MLVAALLLAGLLALLMLAWRFASLVVVMAVRLALLVLTVALTLLVLAVAWPRLPRRPALLPGLFSGTCIDHRQRRGTVAAPIGSRDRDTDQLLDIAQERPLLGVAERDRDAGGAGASGAADAMHVAFRNVRQVVVDH